ncbi:MAG: glycoside hydrolase family 95 protein [Clostridia bacterium]|nr:glycoside hydrolase family 95 protein [Clostridia bacterium]
MSTLLWHNEFINDWMYAFPLGNGRLGAMQYGNPHCEQIEINEESLWSGHQLEEKYHASPEALTEIRKLIFEEKLHKAADLARKTFLSDPPYVRSYESFGEIFVDFFDKSPYDNYRKELELSEAICRVYWTKSGMNFASESFVSEEYDAFVYKLQNEGKPFSCKVTMKRGRDAYTASLSNDTLIMNGRITYPESTQYGEGGEGMSFSSKLKIKTDGELSAEHDFITVINCTYIIVYVSCGTNYNIENFDFDESINCRKFNDECLDKIMAVDYEEIKGKHISDHKKWFDKVKFEMPSKDLSHISCDERLDDFHDGFNDLDLITLYYNFGRYLLIESSGKKAKLPANLQGIWCNGFNPPWGSDYHTNINLQMNYWPAGPANMLETEKTFINYVKKLSEFGKNTAKNVFGANGWVVNHTSDVFGRTGVHDSVDCGFFPMAGPWLCINLWEHYEYTNDKEYLSEIYPVLKGSCEFVKDYLIEDDKGRLITSPSNSPENEFFYIGENGEKQESMLTHGATIDFEIIDALFTRTIHASQLLDNDESFIKSLEEILAKLPPIKVSERYGTIQEWIKDYEETEPGHRHVSQLFALHPGDRINEENPELFEAAKKTIERRISNGGGSTGWSRAWTISFCARLKDGNHAEKHLKSLLSHCTAYNLFDIHPPFQIDGNFGGVAGITEMLIQSHLGTPDNRVIELLPALPDSWSEGKISGIRARGNFVFDLEWKNGKVKKAKVYSESDNILRIKLNDRTGVPAGSEYVIENSILIAEMKAGQSIELEI